MREIPKMLTIQQCADTTGLAYNCIRNLCLQDRIVYIKAGSKYLINFDKFVAYLNGDQEAVVEELAGGKTAVGD